METGNGCFLGCKFLIFTCTKGILTDAMKNRLVAHTATVNWSTGERRHLARIALQAEKPYETPFENI